MFNRLIFNMFNKNLIPVTVSKAKVFGGHCNKMRKKKGKTGGSMLLPNWENPGMTHPGVTCDGCEGPVMGPRWKCSVCPDFDLCKPCKRKGIHSEHIFVKIPFRLRNCELRCYVRFFFYTLYILYNIHPASYAP